MNYRLDLKPIDFIKANHKVQPGGKIQKFIDSECIRQMDPYTPFQSGGLVNSVTIGSKIGYGDIKQNIPYGRYQYYGKLMVSSLTGSAWASKGESKVLTDKDLVHNKNKNPKAGPYWFERMKADHKKNILNGAQKIADRG
jgi:hypothetical protein